ncbi:MAG: methyltransferase family protein [Nitrospirota bacterium]
MLLHDRLQRAGAYLFKYRSYQFFIMGLILFEERPHFQYITDSLLYELFCVGVAFCGVVIRTLTIAFVREGTSGRNTRTQKACELNTTGAYSIVRNPLYVGNYLILLGVSLLAQNHEVVILNSVIFISIYLPIILTEEAFLLDKFGAHYIDYAKSVNCVIPSLKNFKRPDRKFNGKMVLKREHDTWLTTILSLIFVELLREYGTKGRIELHTEWALLAFMVTSVWIALKYMKRTGWLRHSQDQR